LATGHQKLWKAEDYWAVWLGLGIVLLAFAVYWSGGTIGLAANVSLGCFLPTVVLSVLVKHQQDDLECNLVREIAPER